jgi:Zn-dependent M28 family amino/carboxypeptidase
VEIGTVDEESLLRYVTRLAGERHPRSAPRRLDQTVNELKGFFIHLGLETSLDPFPALGRTFYNVTARLPNRAAAAPLLLAAHYDTVQGSPGADDNASGLSVLMEAARILSRAPTRRPVHFIAFGLEEEQLLGSRDYAARLRKEDRAIAGAIVLESVGYTDRRAGSQKAPAGLPISVPSVGDFLGIVANAPSARLSQFLESAIRRHVPELPTVSLTVPGKGELFPDTRRSDHAAFWDCGYPALMLTDTADFRNPHYHTGTDTLETLDFRFMADVARGVLAGILEWDRAGSLTSPLQI